MEKGESDQNARENYRPARSSVRKLGDSAKSYGIITSGIGSISGIFSQDSAMVNYLKSLAFFEEPG